VIEAAIDQVCQANHLAVGAIAGLASLDLKADEVGLVALCAGRQWPLRCFTAEDLKAIPVPNPSPVVAAAVQTPSVAEAAAILAAQGELRVAKQVVRIEGQPGAVTVAIAQAERDYIPHPGHLALVGTGPGDLTQITPAAKQAIGQADAVIGYGLYIDQIRPLCRPGQIVEPWPITQERQRADRAIDLARWGLRVAVVSSGDCGIYGMAGLVLEQLQASGWDGETPSLEVFPGISALQAAAAQVGAPLMHDFCAISLSDLLTPWEVIVKRLEAAAQADFVVALYNPKSKTRTQQIATAHRILMVHRSPETPVAVVKSVYRPDQVIHRTTLGALLEAPIDMVTVVLIGNQSTQRHGPWLITPRGYNGDFAKDNSSHKNTEEV
jgi:cobalt-precorrin 5A hydrolase/precorrin-3B C17-methyltransferase